MNLQEVHKKRKHQQVVIADLLRVYLQSHNCPCAWPQFEYWVGKQRPPNSQDTIQNDLVEAALELPTYARKPPIPPAYFLEAVYHCSVCGAQWQHFSQEWHMLAFHETLLRIDGHTPDMSLIKSILIDRQMITQNSETDLSTLRLPLDQWLDFMQFTST